MVRSSRQNVAKSKMNDNIAFEEKITDGSQVSSKKQNSKRKSEEGKTRSNPVTPKIVAKRSKMVEQTTESTPPIVDERNEEEIIEEMNAQIGLGDEKYESEIETESEDSEEKSRSKRLIREKFPVENKMKENKKDTEQDLEIELEVQNDDFADEEEIVMTRQSAKGSQKRGTATKTQAGSAKKAKTVTKGKDSEAIMSNEMMLQIMAELKSVKEQLKSKSNEQNTNANSVVRNENLVHNEIDLEVSRVQPIKSPSEATIYRPAIEKYQPNVHQRIKQVKNRPQNKFLKPDFEMRLNEFLSSVRLDNQENQMKAAGREKAQPKRKLDFDHEEAESDDGVEAEPLDAREEAQQRIIRAEKQKAQFEPTKGKDLEFPDKPLLDDDSFLHISCDVEDGTAEKARRGEYVELAKLLAKQNRTFVPGEEPGTMEIVNKRSGQTFMLPVNEDKPIRITNFFVWEKAFRIYMALYSEAHPAKATEMIQYVHTIQHASSKYVWENVAYYDRVFRQMMHKNPNRNWGKIYTQMWNIALTDPISMAPRGGKQSSSGGTRKDNKGNCWRFNKGTCTYPNCRFAHRCNSCGSTSHGAHACTKKNVRKSEGKPQQNQQNAPSTSSQTQQKSEDK